MKGRLANLLNAYADEKAALTLSLDVMYYLIDDELSEHHMHSLFSASTRYLVIYSSDASNSTSLSEGPHVNHRQYAKWVEDNAVGWQFLEEIENTSP